MLTEEELEDIVERSKRVKAVRREAVDSTLRCLVWALALVGGMAVISGAVRYFAA